MEEKLEAVLNVLYYLVPLSTFIGSIFLLIKYGGQYENWRRRRWERDERLTKTLELADKIEETCKLPEQIEEISKDITGVTVAVDRLTESVHRHEEYIADSLKERQHLTKGMLAVLDWTIEQGANGDAHEARDAMREYLNDKSHK